MLSFNHKQFEQGLSVVLLVGRLVELGITVTGPGLASRCNLSRRALEPLLQKLVRAEILCSERGPIGGYKLTKDTLSVGDIFRGLQNGTNKSNDLQEPIALIGPRKVASATLDLGLESLLQAFDNIQIQTLLDELRNSGMPSSTEEFLDFNI